MARCRRVVAEQFTAERPGATVSRRDSGHWADQPAWTRARCQPISPTVNPKMLPSRSVRLVAARTTVSRRSGRRKTLGWAGDHRWSQRHAAALLGLVLKHARRVAGFDEAIVSLYAKGLTTADIRAHLAETYGVEVSHDLVSRVTDQVARRAASRHMRCLASVACSAASSCSMTFATVARYSLRRTQTSCVRSM